MNKKLIIEFTIGFDDYYNLEYNQTFGRLTILNENFTNILFNEMVLISEFNLFLTVISKLELPFTFSRRGLKTILEINIS